VLLSVCLKQHARPLPTQVPESEVLLRELQKCPLEDQLKEDGELEKEVHRKMNLLGAIRLGKYMHLDLSQGMQCYG